MATVGGWIASGVVGRRPVAPASQPAGPVSESEVGRATSSLSVGLQKLGSPRRRAPYPAPARNPFFYGDSGGTRAPRLRPGLQGPSARAPAEAPPAGRPSMELVGMAEDPGPDGPVRRAVITAGGGLFLVGKGEMILGRFRVARLDAEVVELEDTQGGPPTILALR